jgi:hypothetical protein
MVVEIRDNKLVYDLEFVNIHTTSLLKTCLSACLGKSDLMGSTLILLMPSTLGLTYHIHLRP